MKNFPIKKNPSPDGSAGELLQILKNNNNNNFSEEKKKREHFHVLLCGQCNLTPKSVKDITRKENYKPIYLMNVGAKTLNKIVIN